MVARIFRDFFKGYHEELVRLITGYQGPANINGIFGRIYLSIETLFILWYARINFCNNPSYYRHTQIKE